MTSRKYSSFKWGMGSFISTLFWLPSAAFASTTVTITAPTANSTIKGTVTISASATSANWYRACIDPTSSTMDCRSNGGTEIGTGATISFNTTTYKNGQYTLEVDAFDVNSNLLGGSRENIGINNSCITITSPATGTTITGTSTPIKTNDTCSGVYFESLYIDSTHIADFQTGTVTVNSTTLTSGTHTVKVTSQSQTNPTSTQLGSASISVKVGTSSTPTPSPVPTATPTPAPYTGGYPMPDASAAALVVNVGFTPASGQEASNATANSQMPSSSQLSTYWSSYNTTSNPVYSAMDSTALTYMSKVTGGYTGSTDQILQWAAIKWGFDPSLARANAATETSWWQNGIGDMNNGVSLGILQIKSASYFGTCDYAKNSSTIQSSLSSSYIQGQLGTQPSCLSYNYTAFAADFKYAYQRVCYDKHNNWYQTEGNYKTDTGNTLLWGCVQAWCSGGYADTTSCNGSGYSGGYYYTDVQSRYNTIINAPTILQGLQSLGL